MRKEEREKHPNTPSHPLGTTHFTSTVMNCPENRKIIPDKLPNFPV